MINSAAKFKYSYAILWLMLVTHIVATITPVNAKMQSIHNQADSVLSAICTGNGVKWVSLSEFYQTGKIAFVDPPLDDKQQPIETKMQCVVCLNHDAKSSTCNTFNSQLFSVTKQNTEVANAVSLFPQNLHKLNALPRAPPSTI